MAYLHLQCFGILIRSKHIHTQILIVSNKTNFFYYNVDFIMIDLGINLNKIN